MCSLGWSVAEPEGVSCEKVSASKRSLCLLWGDWAWPMAVGMLTAAVAALWPVWQKAG